MKGPWALALFLAWGGIALAQAPKEAPATPAVAGTPPAAPRAAPAAPAAP